MADTPKGKPTVFDAVYDSSVSGLSRAAATNDVDKIKTVMKAAKHSLRGADNRGWTAFHWAARHGAAAALEALAGFAAMNDYQVQLLSVQHCHGGNSYKFHFATISGCIFLLKSLCSQLGSLW